MATDIVKKNKSQWLFVLLLLGLAGSFWAWDRSFDTASVEAIEAESESQSDKRSSPPLHPSQDPVRVELIAVIKSQLAAFRESDFPKAYSHATAGIKARFRLEAFELMVTSQYPSIAHSKTAVFGIILDNGDEAVVNVRIDGESSELADYRYLLKREKSAWKIQGVIRAITQGNTI